MTVPVLYDKVAAGPAHARQEEGLSPASSGQALAQIELFTQANGTPVDPIMDLSIACDLAPLEFPYDVGQGIGRCADPGRTERCSNWRSLAAAGLLAGTMHGRPRVPIRSSAIRRWRHQIVIMSVSNYGTGFCRIEAMSRTTVAGFLRLARKSHHAARCMEQ